MARCTRSLTPEWVAGSESAKSYGLVGMNVDELMVRNGGRLGCAGGFKSS